MTDDKSPRRVNARSLCHWSFRFRGGSVSLELRSLSAKSPRSPATSLTGNPGMLDIEEASHAAQAFPGETWHGRPGHAKLGEVWARATARSRLRGLRGFLRL